MILHSRYICYETVIVISSCLSIFEKEKKHCWTNLYNGRQIMKFKCFLLTSQLLAKKLATIPCALTIDSTEIFFKPYFMCACTFVSLFYVKVTVFHHSASGWWCKHNMTEVPLWPSLFKACLQKQINFLSDAMTVLTIC